MISLYAGDSLRTLCLAYKDLNEHDIENWEKEEIDPSSGKKFHPIEQSGFTMLGVIGIRDILKDNIADEINKCHRAHVTVIMVTGDNLETATAIGKSCNICKSSEQSLLGVDFMSSIGDLVCKNCIKLKEAREELAKLNEKISKSDYEKIKNDFRIINEKNPSSDDGKYKCRCATTSKQAIKNISIELKALDLKDHTKNVNHILATGTAEEKEKYFEDLKERAEKKFKDDEIKIRDEVIFNLKVFEQAIVELRVIARCQPEHKLALVTGLKELEYVVAVTVYNILSNRVMGLTTPLL